MKDRGLHLHLLLLAGGAAALVYGIASTPGEAILPIPLLITALVTIGLTFSLIPTEAGNANLSHSVALATGLAFGLRTAALGLAVGLILGHAIPNLLHLIGYQRQARRTFAEAAGDAGQQVIAVVLSLSAFHAAGGMPLALRSEFISAPQIAVTTVIFLLVFSTVQLIQLGAEPQTARDRRQAFLRFVVLLSLLTVPYAVLTAAAASLLGPAALVVLSGMLVVLASVVRSLIVAQRRLQRRYLELESLNQVSQAVRTSLNMQSLLNAIYAQVAHLLGIRSFFIALYDPHVQELSYPLAIKNGRRQEWPSRPLSDRLTDRVILSGEPLLIARDAAQALEEMGLPELDNAPAAWLGVPLAIPQRVLGCLGVFHTEQGKTLTEDDLGLLHTVAAQAAVALENADLYAKTEQRAQALASINVISASMSSSLDPGETLDLVVDSLVELGGGSKAALYLLQDKGGTLELAHSRGLSAEFQSVFEVLDPSGGQLTRAFDERQIEVHPSTADRNIPDPERDALMQEGILASVDLPLETPGGTIGMASVYFDKPQAFRPEQIELVETLVAHSSLALANARAHAATDQALHQQIDHLSRIEAIGRELVSTLNPDDLFRSIVDHSLRATAAETGYLAVRQPEQARLEIVAHRSAGTQREVGARYLDLDSPLVQRAFALQDAFSLEGPEISRDGGVMDSGSNSILAAPIFRWRQGIGLIAVESPQHAAFHQHHLDFLRHLAVQASIAISNANLYQQLEDNLRELSLLYQASVQVSTTLDLESVTMAVADSVSVALEADSVHVSTWDPASQTLITVASVVAGRPTQSIPDRPVDEGATPAIWQAVQGGVPTQTRADRAESPLDVAYMEDRLNSVSILALPLRLGRETVGLVEVAQRDLRTFNEGEIRTAQTIASQAAMAIQNSELFRRIRTSHDRLLAILNSTEEGMAMVNMNGHVLLSNRRILEITGLAEVELIGQALPNMPVENLTRLGFTSREVEEFSGAAMARTFIEAPLTQFRIESPEPAVIERIVHPIRDAAGELIGWLIVLRDVTEREEIEAARSYLTEMIVHDLRSPLTTLLGSLRLLSDSLNQRVAVETGEQALRVSRRSVQQMLGLVNSLLDIARLESRELQLELSEFDLREVMDGISESFIPAANEQGVIFTYHKPEQPMILTADVEKIRRCLMNLVDNAIKFTPEGGQVGVELSEKASAIEVSIHDDGPGIPEDMREKIFERFARVPGNRGRRHGTGLGLAFTKLAIEAHGGEISIDTRPGGGSIFRVYLAKMPLARTNVSPVPIGQAMDSRDSIR